MKAVLLAAALAAAVNVHAQSPGAAPTGDLAALKAALASDKRGYVARELALTPAESKVFWPIYEGYQRQLDTTVRRHARLVEEIVGLDGPLTDANAKRLARELVAIEDEEARDRRRVHNQLMRALPPSKALRYLQIENKAKSVRDYEVAGAQPLVK